MEDVELSTCFSAIEDWKRKKNVLHVLLLLCIAASRAEKIRFYGDLQQALSTIPFGESYILLGDFNARVGSRETANDIMG